MLGPRLAASSFFALIASMTACYDTTGSPGTSSNEGSANQLTGTGSTSTSGTLDETGSTGMSIESSSDSGSSGTSGSNSDTSMTSTSSTGSDTGDLDTNTEAETDSEETDADPCEDIVCHNDGTCIDGTCECEHDFDPSTNCQACPSGRVERQGVCVIDLCQDNPCNVGGDGHGDSCEVNAEGDHFICTCRGDFTPESDCQSCPDDKIPGSGDECVDPMVDPCDGALKFEDPKFEKALRAAIDKPIGPISKNDVSDLGVLDASNYGISALGGVECLDYLVTLILDGNSVVSLEPISNLTQLRALSLEHNSVNDIGPLSDLAELTWLYLTNNEVSNLMPLSNLTKLQWLHLTKNHIFNLAPIVDLPAVYELDVQDNRISCTGQASNIAALDAVIAHNSGTFVHDCNH